MKVQSFKSQPYQVSCVAGRRKGGKGSKQPRENWEEGSRERHLPSRSRASRAVFFPFPFPSTPATRAISTDISLFLPLIVEVTLPDLMIYSLSNPGDTTR